MVVVPSPLGHLTSTRNLGVNPRFRLLLLCKKDCFPLFWACQKLLHWLVSAILVFFSVTQWYAIHALPATVIHKSMAGKKLCRSRILCRCLIISISSCSLTSYFFFLRRCIQSQRSMTRMLIAVPKPSLMLIPVTGLLNESLCRSVRKLSGKYRSPL